MKGLSTILIISLILTPCLAVNETITDQLVNVGIPGTGIGTGAWLVSIFERYVWNPVMQLTSQLFPKNPLMDFWGSMIMPFFFGCLFIFGILSMFQDKIKLIMIAITIITIVFFFLAFLAQGPINETLLSNLTNVLPPME